MSQFAKCLTIEEIERFHPSVEWTNGNRAAIEALGYLQRLEQKAGGILGLSTGFSKIDAATSGLEPGRVWIIGARPGVGKTALACQILSRVAASGTPCAFVTLEQPVDQIVLRMGLGHARLSKSEAVRNRANMKLALEGVKHVGMLPIRYLERPPLWSAIRDSLPELSKEGVKVLAIDYLQLLDRSEPFKSRADALGQITAELKDAAKVHSMTILALAQLNRGSAQGRSERPMIHHLKDAGSIEQDADVVLLLVREEEGGSLTATGYIDIAKNRDGPCGVAPMTFHGSSFRWEEKD